MNLARKPDWEKRKIFIHLSDGMKEYTVKSVYNRTSVIRPSINHLSVLSKLAQCSPTSEESMYLNKLYSIRQDFKKTSWEFKTSGTQYIWYSKNERPTPPPLTSLNIYFIKWLLHFYDHNWLCFDKNCSLNGFICLRAVP